MIRTMTRTLGAMALVGAIAALATPAAAQNINGQPVFGTVNLRAGFIPDPRTVQLRSGGQIDASRLGSECRGMIGARPDVRLNWTGGRSDLTISANSQSDTTIAINGPDGRWYCNDDADGLNPAVTFRNARSGRYEIWVGTFGSTANRPATLRISELGVGSGQNGGGTGGGGGGGGGAAEFITLRTGFTPDPHVRPVLAGGGERASDRFGSSCPGYIADRPDFRLNWTAGSLPLILSVRSESDTTLVVRGPDGRVTCNDDTNGFNPQVRYGRSQSGSYDVWVGTFSSGSPQRATFRVSEIDGRQ